MTTRAPAPPAEHFTVVHNALVLGDVGIRFERTLRVSEQGLNFLPPGFGEFPLRPVDTTVAGLPDHIRDRGGVLMPIYVREAMWINLDSDEPVAVQIGAGGRCVVSGRPLVDRLTRRPQNYVVLPDQPWLDGFKTADGEVRQFVGVPTGAGLSVEHQLTGEETVGGIQIQVWRLTPAALERWRADRARPGVEYSSVVECMAPMALGAGGRISQEVYRDEFAAKDWQSTPAARCWVHLVSAAEWRSYTGEVPPPTPIDTNSYIDAGLPWFDYFDADHDDLPTTDELRSIESVGHLLGEEDATVTASADTVGVIRYGHFLPLPVPGGRWL